MFDSEKSYLQLKLTITGLHGKYLGSPWGDSAKKKIHLQSPAGIHPSANTLYSIKFFLFNPEISSKTSQRLKDRSNIIRLA